MTPKTPAAKKKLAVKNQTQLVSLEPKELSEVQGGGISRFCNEGTKVF